jgi:large subunit ribosomal protein L25
MLKLNAEKRDIFGKKLRTVAADEKIPAVLYGPKMASLPIFVPSADFRKVWKQAGESTVVSLEIGGKQTNVLIHDVVFDPLTNEPIHADFYAALMDKPVKAHIPLEFEGVAPAVKEHGAVLVKVLHSIEVEALPKDLPHEIKVDLKALAFTGDHISAGDIKLPASVKLVTKTDEVVAVAEEPKKEEEALAGPASIEEIEVEKKGKAEEKPEAGEEGK